jgi:hypothetical protein
MSNERPNKLNVASERRRQSALERLGVNNPKCIYCDECDPRCLELHHIAGKKNDPTTIIVCRNCHRKLSDLQKDHPPQTERPRNAMEEIGRFLLGLADIFELLIKKMREFGRELIDGAKATTNAHAVPS